MEYKIGDKVRVKPGHTNGICGDRYTTYIGKVFTIIGLYAEISYYLDTKDGCNWIFTDQQIESYHSQLELQF